MAIQFECDNCGKPLKTDDSKAGRQVKCPGCAKILTIPNPGEEIGVRSNPQAEYDDDENPYRASPSLEDTGTGGENRNLGNYTLAGPVRRLIGAILDSLCGFGFCLPGIILMGVGGLFNQDPPEDPDTIAIIGIGLAALGFIATFVVNVYLLATRSQSLGKFLLGMQILDYETKRPASFVKCAVLRAFVNGLIGAIPCVGAIYSIVDILFVFSEEHRCLHDQLAGTIVVNTP